MWSSIGSSLQVLSRKNSNGFSKKILLRVSCIILRILWTVSCRGSTTSIRPAVAPLARRAEAAAETAAVRAKLRRRLGLGVTN